MDEQFFQKFESNPNGLNHVKSQIDSVEPKKLDSNIKKAGILKQFYYLGKRSVVNFFRNPLTVKVRLIQVIFIALIYILLYWRLDDIDPTDRPTIQNRLGALFFISVNMFILYF